MAFIEYAIDWINDEIVEGIAIRVVCIFVRKYDVTNRTNFLSFDYLQGVIENLLRCTGLVVTTKNQSVFLFMLFIYSSGKGVSVRQRLERYPQ